MFVIVSEFVWYSLVSGSIQMVIFTIQHMCVKYCRRLLGGISKHVFFFLQKKKKNFFRSLYLSVIYMDQLFVWTDFRVSMPLSWSVSCWAHWFALNILLSILCCRDKLRGNEPLRSWKTQFLLKAKTIWVGQKESILMSSSVTSSVPCVSGQGVRSPITPGCVWTPSKDQHWLCI